MLWLALTSFVLLVCLEAFRWQRTLRLFGIVPRWVLLNMLRFARTGKSGHILVCAVLSIGVCIVSLGDWLATGALSAIGLLAIFLAPIGLSVISRSAQPPAVLLLTSSSPRSAELINRFAAATFPLRIVSLVDHRRVGELNPLRWIDNLRTTDPTIWKSVVLSLIDLVPVVVIDTCGESGPVAEETSLMLAPERIRKAVFLTDGVGGYPALSANGIDPYDHALRLFDADEMVEQLSHYSLGRDYLPWPVNFPAIAPQNSLAKETWENLPSLLMIGHSGDFDSKFIMDSAFQSGKDLVACASPWFDISRTGAERLLDLNWEFVHDPRLAAVIVRTQQVVIRIAFLKNFAAEVPLISATGHRGPFTFEELNQPDPVDAALWKWARAVEQVAHKHGWRTREVMSPPNHDPDEPDIPG